MTLSKKPKEAFKCNPEYINCDIEITVPTFQCRVCGEEILDCPSHWQYKPLPNS